MSRGVTAHVRALFSRGTAVGLSERQLLERFLNDRDPAAFEAIIRRHGPMVLCVCRRWLDDPNDADDAFQATFLVLVRKAGSLRDRDLLAAWLHGVATRVAQRARRQEYRRRRREALAASKRADSEATMRPLEFGPELHEELEKLPRPYREVLVLCYLEGRTHEEASAELGWPIGTVKGRLARARDQLRDRLVRRGVLVSVGVLVTALEAESAIVPVSLINATVQTVSAAAVGKLVVSATISASVLSLAKEAMNTMFQAKLATIGAGGLLLAGLATTGAVMARGPFAQRAEGPGPLSKPSAVITKVADRQSRTDDSGRTERPVTAEGSVSRDDEITAIQNAKLELARRNYELAKRAFESGGMSVADFQKAEEAMAAAQLDLAKTENDRMATLQRIVAIRKNSWEQGKQLFERGTMSSAEVNNLELAYLDGRLQLARERAPKKSVPTVAMPEAPVSPPVMAVGGFGGAGGLGGGVIAPDPKEERIQELRRFFFTAIDQDERTMMIVEKLNKVVDVSVQGMQLREFADFIRSMTEDPDHFPKGVPIYLDLAGMKASGLGNMPPTEPIEISLDGVTLKTVLRLALKQVDLVYVIHEGVVMISSPQADSLLQEIEDQDRADQ